MTAYGAKVSLDRLDIDPVLLDGHDTVLVTAAAVGASTLREQDEIIYDPADPDPDRRWKLYFTATGLDPSPAVCVIFSPDAKTWSTPVRCTMGSSDKASEDPSIVTMLHQRGQAYRDGLGRLVIFVEDYATLGICAYASIDGVTWDDLSETPVIPRGGGGWDNNLVGSPVARHDGEQFIVGYEGIGGGYESFGLAVGADPASLTKHPANPVWNAANEPKVGVSIVVDSFFLTDDGEGIVLLAHDGKQAGAEPPPTNTMFRGYTANTDPTTWVDGDIAYLGDADLWGVKNDITVDHSTGLTRVVTTPANDKSLVAKRVVVMRESIDEMKIKAGGSWLAGDLRIRVDGSFDLRFNPLTQVGWDHAFWAEGPRFKALAVSDGEPLASWPDEIDSGVALIATPGEDNRPTYRAADSAFATPAVEFDGSNDILLGSFSSAKAVPFTVVIVARLRSIPAENAFMFRASSTVNHGQMWYEASTGRWKWVNGGTSTTSSEADTDPHLHVCVFADTSETDAEWEIDGALVNASSSLGTGPATLLRLGGYTATSNLAPATVVFAGVYAGDVRDDPGWPAFMGWVSDHYGIDMP